MENSFISKISSLENEQLVKMVTVERHKYVDEAIKVAELELKKRNVNLDEYSDLIKETEKIIKTENKNVSAFTRFINYIIDLIVWLIITYIILIIVFLIVGESNLLPIINILVIPLTYIGYYYFMENKFGRTVGKFLTKTKVVNLKGEKPTKNEILMRSIYRLIPFDNISYLFLPDGLHDRFSNTKVVSVTDKK